MALLSSLPILFARLRGGALSGFFQSLWSRLRSSVFFKFFGVTTLALVLAISLGAHDAQAKRMGGGRSIGRQSHSFQQPHRATTPPNQNQHASSRNQNPAQTPPAQPQRNRWLGPLAGLAAGLGIAALMSHLGLGGALGGMLSNILVVVLIALAAFWIIRLISSRRSNTNVRNEPAFNPAFSTSQTAEPFAPAPAPAPAGTTEPAPSNTIDMPPRLPQPLSEAADFDSEAFLRAAKVLFIRLQTAWDAGDLDDIRKFTTAEMFAEVKLDLTERGTTPSYTSVDQLNAELLSIENQSTEPLASVRFSGLVRETQEQTTAEPFTEVWNFTKETNGEWKLAGIQQLN